MKKWVVVLMTMAVLLPSIVMAVETAPRISDREIIESLTELKAGQKALNKRIDKLDGKIDKLDERIDKLDGKLDNTVRDIKGFMMWGFGITFAGIFSLIGFVLWDRRTALAPAINKNKELEEREEKVERALKEYALKNQELKEILKQVGLL